MQILIHKLLRRKAAERVGNLASPQKGADMAGEERALHKNQHYVPRTHLRPFSHRSEGKTIDLFAETQGRVITGASTSGQCSKSYFYGEDGVLEKSLQELEGHYASTVRKILAYTGGQSPELRGWMRMFWCAQWVRTESAAQNAKAMLTGAADLISHPPLAEGPAHGRWVLVSMGAMKDAYEFTDDLAAALLINKTNTPFLTSDNPAVTTNKLHTFDARVSGPGSGHGLNSAGATLFLPLSPWHAICYYDPDVYRMPGNADVVQIKNAEDVHALNELQVLYCHRNAYFSQDFPHEWVRREFETTKAERAKPLWEISFAVAEGASDGRERYRVLPKGAPVERRNGLIITEQVHRKPSRWPSFLMWKPRGYAFDTRTGAGVVRRSYFANRPTAQAIVIRTGK
jgi:hypothetical protein